MGRESDRSLDTPVELGNRPHVASSGVHKFREHDTGGRWLGVEEGGAWVNMHFQFSAHLKGRWYQQSMILNPIHPIGNSLETKYNA